MKEVRDLTNRR